MAKHRSVAVPTTQFSGWWYTYPSEKYEFVSWDDYSQLNGKIKFMFNVPNHQPVFVGSSHIFHALYPSATLIQGISRFTPV